MTVDSEASEHLMVCSSCFETSEDVDEAISEIAHGNKTSAKQKGKVPVELGAIRLTLSIVIYIPALQMNTLYCSPLGEHGISTIVSISI